MTKKITQDAQRLSSHARDKTQRLIGKTFLFLALLLFPCWANAAEDAPFFTKKILPVLVQHCYECHSAEADEVRGNLRVDTRQGLRSGGDNGPAVVPGEPEESFLLSAIKYQEDDYQMPPNGKLSDEIIAAFEKWIKAGAPDPRKPKAAKRSDVTP